jgi:transketolase
MINIFRKIPVKPGKPHLIIARTIKGKGVSFIENNMKWHHRVPDEEQFQQAIKEIDARISQLT